MVSLYLFARKTVKNWLLIKQKDNMREIMLILNMENDLKVLNTFSIYICTIKLDFS